MSSETTSAAPVTTTGAPVTTTGAPVAPTAEEVPKKNTYKLGFDTTTQALAIVWIVLAISFIFHWLIKRKFRKYASSLLIIAYIVIWIILIVLHKKQGDQNRDDRRKVNNMSDFEKRRLFLESINSKKTEPGIIIISGVVSILLILFITFLFYVLENEDDD